VNFKYIKRKQSRGDTIDLLTLFADTS
jgi:hypothetical protein